MNPEFIKKIKIDFMEGVEEPWCNNQGVAILPYVLKENLKQEIEYYYLLVKENNPLFKNKQISEYSTITGGLENLNPYLTVINELKEEVGIIIDENHENVEIYYLGKHYANKSSTKLWYFFAVNLTRLDLNLTAIYKGIGDGTEAEKNIKGKFINEKQLNKSNDTLSLTSYAKLLLNRIKEKHRIEHEAITEWVEEHDDEKYLYEDINSQNWLSEITDEEWINWNFELDSKIKKIDELKLISSSISPLIDELKKEAQNFKNSYDINKSEINKLVDKNYRCPEIDELISISLQL